MCINKILVFTALSNVNSAYANRLKCELKGFQENGVEPIVYALGANIEIAEAFKKENITFHLLSLNKNKLLNYLFSLIKSIFLIRKYNVVFFSLANYWVIRILYFFSKKSTKIIHERTEHPSLFGGEKYLKSYLKLCCNFDKLLVISTSLRTYFVENGIAEDKICLYPMLFNPQRLDKSDGEFLDFPYMAYTGEMSGNKDGVYNLIESFSLFSMQNQDYRLVLVGDSYNKNEFNKIKQHVIDKGLKDRVIFTGRVTTDKVLVYLRNAKILLLARPNNFQAKYGFPTKLGEYLATGNPVIVTKTSDIAMYLKDGESAFIVQPDDNNAFASKMLYVVDNYEKAIVVGNNGKMKVYDDFNYFIQTKELLNKLDL